MMNIKALIKAHEGEHKVNGRHIVYKCPAGKWTGGYGRNLENWGMSDAEAEIMLDNDIKGCTQDLRTVFTRWEFLPTKIQNVLIDMRFNLGPSGFRSFKKMIQAVKDRNWQAMKESMILSAWYKQVGNRSKNLVTMVDEVINENTNHDA